MPFIKTTSARQEKSVDCRLTSIKTISYFQSSTECSFQKHRQYGIFRLSHKHSTYNKYSHINTVQLNQPKANLEKQ